MRREMKRKKYIYYGESFRDISLLEPVQTKVEQDKQTRNLIDQLSSSQLPENEQNCIRIY